jgi:hypothetical protein
MNEVQVLITRASDGQAATITQRLDDLRWTTAVNGGFGSASLFLPGDPQQVLAETRVEFLADIKILGPGGRWIGDPFTGLSDVLYNGRIEDISLSVEDGRVGVMVECGGYQSLLSDPYRNMPIRPESQGITQDAITDPVHRPEWARLAVGQGQSLDSNLASAPDTRGLVFRVAPSQAASVNWQNSGVDWLPFAAARVKFDLYSNPNPAGASMVFLLSGLGSYAATISFLVNTSPGNATSLSVALPSGFQRGVRYTFYNSAAHAGMASYAWMLVQNPRVLAPRGPSALTDEPVYGHELIQDVIFNSGLTKEYSLVDSDTSYQFTTADFSGPGQTLRAALDYITGFYSRYWAVWENQTVVWKSTVLTTTPDWTVSAKQGVKFVLDPSIAEAARSVRVSYADVRGVTREITVADPRLDNVYAVAGASKQAQIQIPVVTNSSAAQQIANTYFPDHSYEVLRGKIVIPAQTMCARRDGGALPAYKIRAGDSIRLLDAATPRDYFSTQYDRKTTLFIRTTDVDWEAQTITLEVDNTRDSISTLLARVALQTQSKFPGT